MGSSDQQVAQARMDCRGDDPLNEKKSSKDEEKQDESIPVLVGGMYVDNNACCVLLVVSEVDEGGNETKWVVKGAYDETRKEKFGQSWTTSMERVGMDKIKLLLNSQEDINEEKKNGKKSVKSEVDDKQGNFMEGVVDDRGITWKNGFRWERFHMTREQFFVLTRPPPLFLTVFIFRKMFNLISVPYVSFRQMFWSPKPKSV